MKVLNHFSLFKKPQDIFLAESGRYFGEIRLLENNAIGIAIF